MELVIILLIILIILVLVSRLRLVGDGQGKHPIYLLSRSTGTAAQLAPGSCVAIDRAA